VVRCRTRGYVRFLTEVISGLEGLLEVVEVVEV
jgi:hypothetical protein